MNFDAEGDEGSIAREERPGPSSRAGSGDFAPSRPSSSSAPVSFDRRELREILSLYGRMVARGEWRDYALDFTPTRAVFSVFRRTSETPLFRIVKDPRLERKQGSYCVIAPTGLILKRGHDLRRVLAAVEPRPRLMIV
jgi:hypothetical protein